jgi:hypothetical protein
LREVYSIGVAAVILDNFYHMVVEFVKFEHNFHESNMVANELPRVGLSTGWLIFIWCGEKKITAKI